MHTLRRSERDEIADTAAESCWYTELASSRGDDGPYVAGLGLVRFAPNEADRRGLAQIERRIAGFRRTVTDERPDRSPPVTAVPMTAVSDGRFIRSPGVEMMTAAVIGSLPYVSAVLPHWRAEGVVLVVDPDYGGVSCGSLQTVVARLDRLWGAPVVAVAHPADLPATSSRKTRVTRFGMEVSRAAALWAAVLAAARADDCFTAAQTDTYFREMCGVVVVTADDDDTQGYGACSLREEMTRVTSPASRGSSSVPPELSSFILAHLTVYSPSSSTDSLQPQQ